MPKPKKNPLPPLAVEIGKVGRRIVKVRKLRGFTQKELADRIGITRDILASYESGRAHLNDEMIIRFSIALRISADELLGLKKSDYFDNEPPNIRLIRRMLQIQELTQLDQKSIIRTIDNFLRGAGKPQEE